MTVSSSQPWPTGSPDTETQTRNPVSTWLIICIALSAAIGFFSSEISQAFEGSKFGRRTTAIAGRLSDKILLRVTGMTEAQRQVGKVGEPKIAAHSIRTAAVNFPICGAGKRLTCVVDGDTFWLNGEKIRLNSIDAPEVKGKCSHETRLAAKATQRLAQILSHQAFTIERSGVDRFGRTLASVAGSAGEAGHILVREGLARPWKGHKEVWCNS